MLLRFETAYVPGLHRDRYRVTYQTAAMKAPAFYYFDSAEEAHDAYPEIASILARAHDHILAEMHARMRDDAEIAVSIGEARP